MQIADIYAGDTVKVELTAPRGGTAVLILSNQERTITAAGDAQNWATITAAQSAMLSPGRYNWFVRWIYPDGTKKVAETGSVNVLPAPDAVGVDRRSVNRRILDALLDVAANRASDDVLERDVDGVRLKYASGAQLDALIEKYQIRVNEEEGNIVLPGSVGLVFRRGVK